ncbi:MAG: DUF4097 domain-containing protein [Clostridia bacterium]|nr:DUF4097 domain-containing protein [Clostridia bacterium]
MKIRNIVLITAGCCVIVGAIISGAAAAKMINTHVYEDKPVKQEISEKINRIDIKSEYGGINILPSENDKITVEYVDCEVNRYQVDVSNGVLLVKPVENSIRDVRENWFDRILNIDIHRHESYIMNIKIPNAILPDIDVEDNCGAVEVSDVKFKNMNCNLNYGGLKIHNVTADSINVESDCGDVEFKNVTADIRTECDFGEIRFDRIKSKNITLDNDYGDIKGTIVGKEEDYTINAEIDMGAKNIQNRTGGQNKLDASVDAGDINIKFVE